MAGQLSAGHARILVGLANQEELAKQIIERGYNVRQVEAIAQERAGGGRRPQPAHIPPRQGRGHGCVRETPVGCARPSSQSRRARGRRRAAYPLQESRTVGGEWRASWSGSGARRVRS
jgi:hypothetical protein